MNLSFLNVFNFPFEAIDSIIYKFLFISQYLPAYCGQTRKGVSVTRKGAKAPTAYFATSALCKIPFDRAASNKKLRQMNNSNALVAGAPMENGSRRAVRSYVIFAIEIKRRGYDRTQTRLAKPVT